MRLGDYVTALVLGFLVGLIIWITLSAPIAVLYATGVIHTYPIWTWPFWVAGSVGASVATLIIVLERCFDRA